MTHCIIRRKKGQPWGTPGTLRSDRGFACDTLELPWKNNQRGVSCIIADTYMGWVWQSPTMGRAVVRLEDKHGRRDCLIHNGNWAGDTSIDDNIDGKPDFVTQIHGCTEVGQGFGMIVRPDGTPQMGILSSKPTLALLVAHLGAGHHTFTYQWEDGCEP